jgi:uncharacterized membrane-anchored protein
MHHALPASRTSLRSHRLPQSAWTRLLRNKVPELTLTFWALTLLSTILGAAIGEFLAGDLGLEVPATTAVLGLLLAIALIAQFSLRRHLPAAYWPSVTLVSAVGSLLTDNLTEDFGVGPWASAAVFGLALAVTLTAWYASERTLSIHTVVTRRREAFYWLALSFTFAVGTCVADLVLLGNEASLVLWSAVVAALAIAYQRGLDGVSAYWAAYVVTWPLGAALVGVLAGPVTTGLALAGTISGVGWSALTARRQPGAGQGVS